MSIYFDYKTINELIGDNNTRQINQDVSKFTLDDWGRYITPLVTYALRETTQGMNIQSSYEKFILLGVLVGQGKSPQEAIAQIENWQKTSKSQIPKSSTSFGTTPGIMGSSGGTGSSGLTGGSGGTGGSGSTGITSGTGSSGNIGSIGGSTNVPSTGTTSGTNTGSTNTGTNTSTTGNTTLGGNTIQNTSQNQSNRLEFD